MVKVINGHISNCMGTWGALDAKCAVRCHHQVNGTTQVHKVLLCEVDDRLRRLEICRLLPYPLPVIIRFNSSPDFSWFLSQRICLVLKSDPWCPEVIGRVVVCRGRGRYVEGWWGIPLIERVLGFLVS